MALSNTRLLMDDSLVSSTNNCIHELCCQPSNIHME